MELTVELLMSYFDQAREHVKKRMPEHRKGGRLTLSAETGVMGVEEKGAALELTAATVRDLSSVGISLITKCALGVGREFVIRLTSEKGAGRWVRCKVNRWQASQGGRQIGARFMDLVCTDTGELPMLIDPTSAMMPGTSADLRKLCESLLVVEGRLNPEAAPQTKEKKEGEHRRVKRAAYRHDQVVHVLKNGKATLLSAKLLDISTSGIGFECQKAIPTAERVAMILRFSNNTAKAVLGRVARCQQLGPNLFRIGAEFLESCKQSVMSSDVPVKWRASTAG